MVRLACIPLPAEAGISLFASAPALGPTQPPIQCVPGALYTAVKRPGRESDHSRYLVSELNNWIFASTPLTYLCLYLPHRFSESYIIPEPEHGISGYVGICWNTVSVGWFGVSPTFASANASAILHCTYLHDLWCSELQTVIMQAEVASCDSVKMGISEWMANMAPILDRIIPYKATKRRIYMDISVTKWYGSLCSRVHNKGISFILYPIYRHKSSLFLGLESRPTKLDMIKLES
jgi:hypothetical protein